MTTLLTYPKTVRVVARVEQAAVQSAIDRVGLYGEGGPPNLWEGISRTQSLRMHTRGTAYQLHQEKSTGTLESLHRRRRPLGRLHVPAVVASSLPGSGATMRRRNYVPVVTAVALAFGIAGCTDSPESGESSPVSNSSSEAAPTGELPDTVDPSSSGEPGGGDTALTQAGAQAALDDALAAVDKEGSIGFRSRGESVIDDEVTKISGSGAWTRQPLAWTTTTTLDRPKGRTIDSLGDQTTKLIYVEATAEGPYVNTIYPDLPKRWQPPGWTQIPGWMEIPGYGVREGVTKKDLTTPPDLRMLVQTDASAGSVLGDTITISGTFPTPWALDALDLTEHVSDLGLANRFEDSTTRVLVTIGADGLPQRLEFSGTGIRRPEEGLPDYVVEELAGARYLVEYGDAKLDGPIKAPDNSLTP